MLYLVLGTLNSKKYLNMYQEMTKYALKYAPKLTEYAPR